MAVITAAMVKELRVKTDAPMMECKKALTEADGNMEQAEEILRVKLGNKATKAASRITADGVVAIYIDEPGKIGAIVELNSETDFVAKNADFIAFANDIAKLVAENKPADVAALSALPLNGSTVDEVRKGLIGKIVKTSPSAASRSLKVKASSPHTSTAAPRSALSLTWSAATTKLLTTWLCTSLLLSRRLSTKTVLIRT